MSNILAIAHRELKSYFSSPLAYVLIGCFLVVYGFFFGVILQNFERMSAQLGAMGQQAPFNVNQQLIQPVFMNVSVILLLVLPLVTMRTYAEEKRSGTIELLLTAPLTDVQIVLGKFFGTMGLIAAMLALTAPHMAILFWFADPEWKPILTTYLGFLLMSGCFVSVGLFLSSLTQNQVIAGVSTFAVFLMLWIVNWMSGFVEGTRAKAVIEHLSLTGHFEDFTRGVIDTNHLVYYVSFIFFGLFLTVRSVDTVRWRG
jgi:ABC-2 type transport system permease protein